MGNDYINGNGIFLSLGLTGLVEINYVKFYIE